ncbi:MAG: hypothetical protein JWO68_3852, partial [Actinomycetia bacterium]|nr:hypothetical protein [Actinomycetes bacterium]
NDWGVGVALVAVASSVAIAALGRRLVFQRGRRVGLA